MRRKIVTGSTSTDVLSCTRQSPTGTKAVSASCSLFLVCISMSGAAPSSSVRAIRCGSTSAGHRSPTDLLVVRNERRHLLGRTRLEGPADFVIEIASHSDPGLDIREKLPRYREAGVDEIWLVNPFEQVVRVEVREPGGYAAQRLSAGRLTSRVVPGFGIEVGWLWQERLPSTLVCLREILAAA